MQVEPEYRLSALLRGSGKTISAAESCTGGNISHHITLVSGSSEYYLGSVTSYSIAIKESLLKVPTEIIKEFGVVSSEVAVAMAEGVRKVMGSTYSVATTGLAEGSDDKYPEGTVWMAVSGHQGSIAKLYQCDLGRSGNIREFTREALNFLADYIEKDTSK